MHFKQNKQLTTVRWNCEPGLFISIPRSFGDCLRKAFSYDPLNIRRPVFRCQVSKTKNSSPFSCDPNICKSEEDEAGMVFKLSILAITPRRETHQRGTAKKGGSRRSVWGIGWRTRREGEWTRCRHTKMGFGAQGQWIFDTPDSFCSRWPKQFSGPQEWQAVHCCCSR